MICIYDKLHTIFVPQLLVQLSAETFQGVADASQLSAETCQLVADACHPLAGAN